jgi:hypothetical protein
VSVTLYCPAAGVAARGSGAGAAPPAGQPARAGENGGTAHLSDAAALPPDSPAHYAGPDRRTPPAREPGTALTAALASGVTAGVTGARAAAELGTMGLPAGMRGWANATAMVVIVAFMFLIYRDFTRTVSAEREYERIRYERSIDSQAKDREAFNAELRALTSEIRADREAQRGMTAEVRGLVSELRAGRLKEER